MKDWKELIDAVAKVKNHPDNHHLKNMIVSNDALLEKEEAQRKALDDTIERRKESIEELKDRYMIRQRSLSLMEYGKVIDQWDNDQYPLARCLAIRDGKVHIDLYVVTGILPTSILAAPFDKIDMIKEIDHISDFEIDFDLVNGFSNKKLIMVAEDVFRINDLGVSGKYGGYLGDK